jgi:hypothetical protein
VRRRLALVLAAGILGGLALPAGAQAEDYCSGILPPNEPTPEPATAPLRFGIFPGGAAGSVLPVRPAAKPDNQEAILYALDLLRPANGPFRVHLYAEFTDDPTANARSLDDSATAADIFGAAGYGVDQVVRYRSSSGDAAGFAAFIRTVVDRLASKPALAALQVTNEANFTAAPDSADGAYANAQQALVGGVIAADDEARGIGSPGLPVGFNWFYRTTPGAEEGFWTGLGTLGGDAFRNALDWVGLDAYPGTFFPPLADPTEGRGAMLNAMDVLRNCFMDLADLDDSVEMHVTENGYPTDLAARTPAMQDQYLETMLGTVNEFRGNFNVTDYFWFDLRDGDSSSPDFGQHYGLLNDDYSEKPAFGTYCNLVAELSGDSGGCASSQAGLSPPSNGSPVDSLYAGSASKLRTRCRKKRRHHGKRAKRSCARKHRGHKRPPRGGR